MTECGPAAGVRRSLGKVLVSGATGFVGYHLVKQLVERGVRPRVLVRETSDCRRLAALPVERVTGDIEDPESLAAAARGIDTIFHAAAVVSSDPREARRLQRVNVLGSRNVVATAREAGVGRLVLTSTVATIGVSRDRFPLDETADWTTHGLEYPYAVTKRAAECEALATAGLEVVAVNPSIVLGPEDYGPSAGGRLIRDLVRGRIPGGLRAGISCVDVRDVALGHLLAAEEGRPGERYILSTANLMMSDFFRRVAELAGSRPPRYEVPYPIVYTAALLSEGWSGLTGRPPGVTRGAIRIAGRYAWYDAGKAGRELGWRPRPVEETLEETAAWFRDR